MRDRIPLLANSRVTILAAVPEPLFDGIYEVVVTAGDPTRQRLQQASQSYDVSRNEFPAQSSVVAQVVRDVEVSPSQLELSVVRGGSRLMPLTLRNRGEHTIDVSLDLQGAEGSELAWIVVRPKEFKLPAGRKRKVMIAVRGGATQASNQYGRMIVAVSSAETTSIGTHELPIALICESGPNTPTWTAGSASWVFRDGQNAILLPIQNLGSKHLAVHAKLKATDELGRQFTSEAGFNRWVIPKQTETLAFPTARLPAGRYDLEFEVTPAPSANPEYHQQSLDVTPTSIN